MAETYGELVTRLCQLRDEMRRTPEGRQALKEVIAALRGKLGRDEPNEWTKEEATW